VERTLRSRSGARKRCVRDEVTSVSAAGSQLRRDPSSEACWLLDLLLNVPDENRLPCFSSTVVSQRGMLSVSAVYGSRKFVQFDQNVLLTGRFLPTTSTASLPIVPRERTLSSPPPRPLPPRPPPPFRRMSLGERELMASIASSPRIGPSVPAYAPEVSYPTEPPPPYEIAVQ
jgi:hypothetical protein